MHEQSIICRYTNESWREVYANSIFVFPLRCESLWNFMQIDALFFLALPNTSDRQRLLLCHPLRQGFSQRVAARGRPGKRLPMIAAAADTVKGSYRKISILTL